MNYNHLFYFWNIAKEGSIKSASEKLNLSQPTLSDQLKTFENAIGGQLFKRKGRRLIINELGELTYAYANNMFRIGGELNNALLHHESKKPRRVFKIGFVPTIAKGRIYEILVPFLNHEKFVINVIEGEFDFIYNSFEMDDLDMMICENPIYKISSKVKVYKLIESIFHIASAPMYEKAINDFPKSLSEIPFINYTNKTNIQNQIFKFFNENDISPHIVGEIDDVNIIRRFTQNGHCFSILPQSVICDYVKDRRLISLSKINDIKIAIYAIIKDDENNKDIYKILEQIE